MTADTIERRFESSPNALNFLRLCAALQVLAWHAYALRGDSWLPRRLEPFLADIAVDSFFAMSGFLICRAWLNRPDVRQFLRARAARILPALWVCLCMTAFVIVPIVAWISGTEQVSWSGRSHYVAVNAGVWVREWGIDGSPVGIPHPGAWNGSLWSLGYEVACYALIALLGLFRVLRPGAVAALVVVFWVMSAQLTVAGFTPSGQPLWLVPRCGLMFTCGTLLWLCRNRVPLSRTLVLTCLAVVAMAVAALPSYRLVSAPAVAYLCIALGLYLGQAPRLVLRHDLSYGVYVYGFVIQQALLVCAVRLPWLPFFLISSICVLPVAATSWFLIERPALTRLRRGPDGPSLLPHPRANPATVIP